MERRVWSRSDVELRERMRLAAERPNSAAHGLPVCERYLLPER
jgi:hypothetical protein